MMLKVVFICLFAVIKIVTTRKLILSEISGASLRHNNLYIRPPAENTEKIYKINCSLPSDVTGAVSWVPTPTPSQGSVVQNGSNSILFVRDTGNTVSEFNCTGNTESSKTFDPTTFKFYKQDKKIKINDTNEIFINISDTSANPITLVCEEDPKPADPKNTFAWFLDQIEVVETARIKLNEGNGTLIINYPAYVDIGVYMCKLKSNMSRLAFYNVTGAVFIPLKHGSRWASIDSSEDATVKISYEIYGNPLNATSITWKRTVDKTAEELNDGNLLNKHPEFMKRLFFNPTIHGEKGELELKDLVKSDRAEFTINVTNIYGQTDFTTLVRVKGKLDALWPFLGILIELAILFAIIFVYERKRAKQDIAEESDYGQNKKSLTTPVMTENEDNLRLRKL